MKFKKALAGILSVAMIVTLMPAAAFATTSGSVQAAVKVEAGAAIKGVKVEFKEKNKWDANKPSTLTLKLDNGEFADVTDVTVDGNSIKGKIDGKGALVDLVTLTTTEDIFAIEKDGVSVNSSAITLVLKTKNDALKDKGFDLKFDDTFIKAKDTEGPVKLKIESDNDRIAKSELTIAKVVEGKTVATVIDDVDDYTMAADETDAFAKFRIKEGLAGSLGKDANVKFKLRLSKGAKWDTLNAGGNLLKDVDITKDGRTAEVKATTKDTEGFARWVDFTGKISIDRKTTAEEVTVDIIPVNENNVKTVSEVSDLKIAKIGTESVKVTTVDEKEIPTVIAGREKNKKDKYFWTEVTIKEATKGSLTQGKYVNFEFPSYVQVSKDAVSYKKDGKGKLKDAAKYTTVKPSFEDNWTDEHKYDTSNFRVQLTKDIDSADKADTIQFYIPITVKADYTGDIKVKVTGNKAGVPETELTVAKVVAPITVETKVTKVINGAQNQALADIIIKETEAGFLKTGKFSLSLDVLGLSNGISITDAKAEVTEGDLVIDDKAFKAEKGAFPIKVKESSVKKASTIKISGVKASLSRLLPEGEYNLEVAGEALCDNSKYNNKDFDVAVVKVPYVHITTAADTQQSAVNSVFVVGDMNYTVNGNKNTMDVAPYIDGNNRTMVPIRFVANALGVADQNITYNAASTTATISGKDSVVKVTTGTNILTCSTGNITMDTAAVNSNGRLYVPVRFIANALGAQVSWDPATKTVNIFTATK